VSCLRYLCLFGYSGVQHTLCWFSFVLVFWGFFFLRLVYTMLPVSLDCPFLIASSVFSNVCKHNKTIRYAIENDKHQ
jgi:hypothetical protein